ncbi:MULTISPECIES: hypothetical protein [Maricaulis]|uniref:hypothetical protein n=1 Tax=Maricaulis TaxID=74317 RepID=UPI0025BC6D6E|nr:MULTISPECIES: hypothetical protein [Maricaulis]
MYIITARRIISGEVLKYLNGLRIGGGYKTATSRSSRSLSDNALVMVEANSFNMSAFVFRESQDETKSVMIIVFMLVDGVRIHWAGKPN